MIRITVKGGTQTQKKYTKSMVEFSINKLMPRMKTLEINVHIKDFKDDDSYGYALSTENADHNRPRSFDIEINKASQLRRLIETVAHEMVHVKQFARGELFLNMKSASYRWNGKKQNPKLDYWDSPWEIEAHGRQCGMFVQWAEFHELGGHKWTFPLM